MTIQDAARSLYEARSARRPAGPLPPGIAPRDVAEGIQTQLALARIMSADPPGGFKIGAIARRMQENLGIHAPIAGFMRAQDIHPTGIRLPFSAFRSVGVECELAVRLGADLAPSPCDAARASAAVAELFPAIEIVENRYGPDLTTTGVPTLIADQMFHAAAVIGDSAPWRQVDLATTQGEILCNGTVIDRGVGADLMGHPMQSLAWLAASPEAKAFGGLRKGQVIMLGSVTPPVWLDAPGHIVVRFTSLGEVSLTLT
jgi:2-keto-4-pentenoate hydratase